MYVKKLVWWHLKFSTIYKPCTILYDLGSHVSVDSSIFICLFTWLNKDLLKNKWINERMNEFFFQHDINTSRQWFVYLLQQKIVVKWQLCFLASVDILYLIFWNFLRRIQPLKDKSFSNIITLTLWWKIIYLKVYFHWHQG